MALVGLVRLVAPASPPARARRARLPRFAGPVERVARQTSSGLTAAGRSPVRTGTTAEWIPPPVALSSRRCPAERGSAAEIPAQRLVLAGTGERRGPAARLTPAQQMRNNSARLAARRRPEPARTAAPAGSPTREAAPHPVPGKPASPVRAAAPAQLAVGAPCGSTPERPPARRRPPAQRAWRTDSASPAPGSPTRRPYPTAQPATAGSPAAAPPTVAAALTARPTRAGMAAVRLRSVDPVAVARLRGGALPAVVRPMGVGPV